MYLKEIEFQNYGALKNMKYTFQFNSDGTPKPTLFIGKNGSGKTLLLSNIIHSLIEMKRRFYCDIPEVSNQNYYRLGSEHYISSGENYAYTKINFDNATYTDLMIRDHKKFKEIFDPNILPNIPIDNMKDNDYYIDIKDNDFYIDLKEPLNNVFQKEIFSFFPVERYYIPTWENKDNNKLRFVVNDSVYVGYNDNSMIKNNLLQDIESWILDLLIDQYMYEKKLISLVDNNGNKVDKPSFLGKNTNILNMIDNILSKIFKNKYKSVRFAVTPKNKGKRQIDILGMLDNNKEVVVVPTFSNLSSGEAMIFGMMASILKDYDTFSDLHSIDFKDISGIVLIDEIDIHLHSDLLKDVLPHLIRTFPRIQFIITSHSPFFLLGMKKVFNEKCNFVTLPTGTITNQIERFDEIEHCYAIVDDSYKEILLSLDKAQEKLHNLNKPLIITEGKTDWKHIKHALSKFQKNGDFQNLDVDFWEYEEALGDSKLKTLLENLAKIHQSHKIIGIFDSDTPLGKQYIEIKEFGNNVYACCIEDVQNYGCGVSIELLYKRDDLRICDNNGHRLYLSDEFTEKPYRFKDNTEIICFNNIIKGAHAEKIIKIVDSDVFDSEDSIALSKNEFADNIYNEIENFSNVNLDGFRHIIEKIQSICNK